MALRRNAHAIIVAPMSREGMVLHVGHVVGGAPPVEAPGSVVTRVSLGSFALHGARFAGKSAGFAQTIVSLAHAAGRELAAPYNAMT